RSTGTSRRAAPRASRGCASAARGASPDRRRGSPSRRCSWPLSVSLAPGDAREATLAGRRGSTAPSEDASRSMRNVVFVAPFAIATTLRFIRSLAALPDVRLALVTQDALESLPADVAAALAGHWRVPDALDAAQLEAAVRGVAAR